VNNNFKLSIRSNPQADAISRRVQSKEHISQESEWADTKKEVN